MTARSPIDPDRYVGTVTLVNASQVQANLPHATARPERRGLSMGGVGDFVFVDCERVKLLGRIVEVKIPDAERLSVEPQLGTPPSPHPIGRIQLLATVSRGESSLTRGLKTYPRIGDGVYLAEGSLLAEMIDNAVAAKGDLTLALGRIDAADGLEIRLPPEKIFGRHCGVFGATGGGKSWTIATLVHQLKKARGKAIIFDPTGEFTKMKDVSTVFAFDAVPGATRVYFPYRKTTEDDLFTLFRPSGQSQGPKLRDAIKSLKLVQALNGVFPAGLACNGSVIEKLQRPRDPYFSAIRVNASHVHSPLCDFDIQHLAEQIKLECVFQSGNAGQFGGQENNTVGHCETLVSRISTFIHSKELECLFGTRGASLVDELHGFLSDPGRDIAVISFREVRFEHNTREVLLNVIGRYLLGLARAGQFREQPLVIFLDEAHQFLGRSVGDEYSSAKLDAFGLIAKEGRKYGLTCVLSTQRPRDIPQDVLSQLGTLFVHRLTNDQDREVVERACGDLDKAAAQFIPMLAPGEAVLIGPDLPAPVPLNIIAPLSPPDSKGPPFQDYWRKRASASASASANPPPAKATPPTMPTAAASVTPLPDDLDDEIPF